MKKLRDAARKAHVCVRCLKTPALANHTRCRGCLLREQAQAIDQRERQAAEEEAALEQACAEIEIERLEIVARMMRDLAEPMTPPAANGARRSRRRVGPVVPCEVIEL